MSPCLACYYVGILLSRTCENAWLKSSCRQSNSFNYLLINLHFAHMVHQTLLLFLFCLFVWHFHCLLPCHPDLLFHFLVKVSSRFPLIMCRESFYIYFFFPALFRLNWPTQNKQSLRLHPGFCFKPSHAHTCLSGGPENMTRRQNDRSGAGLSKLLL